MSAYGSTEELFSKATRHTQGAADVGNPKPRIPFTKAKYTRGLDDAPPHQLFFSPFYSPNAKRGAVQSMPQAEENARARSQATPAEVRNGPRPATLVTRSSATSSASSEGSSKKLRGHYYPPSVPTESYTIISLKTIPSASSCSLRCRQSTPMSSSSSLISGSQAKTASLKRGRRTDVTPEHKLFQTQFGFGTPGWKRRRGVPDAR
ncbi:hypothetical protein BDY19DRAFT_269306 [Irpex rosettiformis]|uniref:Uncharacterized protein n=1 Tax=Irpex rosettiformis TaxID=378272 RepID=A0ACB8UI35_9APHY|nr:hypothetical protein BDY19DRAFT_269306 [Irpex rosettiformis]